MSVFSNIGGVKPRRNAFKLDFDVKTTMNMGIAYPCCGLLMNPGDTFKVSHDVVLNANPMVAPPYAEMSFYVYDFFVPLRILWDDWEKFITRGATGDEAIPLPKFELNADAHKFDTLWDYFGFPTNKVPTGASAPTDFLWRAYNLIWNEYFRAENFQAELPIVPQNDPVELELNLTKKPDGSPTEYSNPVYNYMPQRVNWSRDLLTTALPFQQRGTAGALPITGTGSAVWSDSPIVVSNNELFNVLPEEAQQLLKDKSAVYPTGSGSSQQVIGSYTFQNTARLETDKPLRVSVDGEEYQGVDDYTLVQRTGLNDNTIDFSEVGTADVSDLRLMFAIQKWQERNARAGVRYKEFLLAHYGTHNGDDRLQRPQFVGGSRTPILINQVLQQSYNADSAQGKYVGAKFGEAMTADSNYSGKFYASEFGIFMSICFIRPKTSYMDGINRQWLQNTTFDFFNPLFVNLSEQEVFNEEVYAVDGDSDPTQDPASNRSIWGFTPRYQEFRFNNNMVTGKMRPIEQTGADSTFHEWHMAREFDALPNLNGKFLQCDPSKRSFAVQDEVQYLVHIGNRIRALRPLPYMAEPGLIDHN